MNGITFKLSFLALIGLFLFNNNLVAQRGNQLEGLVFTTKSLDGIEEKRNEIRRMYVTNFTQTTMRTDSFDMAQIEWVRQAVVAAVEADGTLWEEKSGFRNKTAHKEIERSYGDGPAPALPQQLATLDHKDRSGWWIFGRDYDPALISMYETAFEIYSVTYVSLHNNVGADAAHTGAVNAGVDAFMATFEPAELAHYKDIRISLSGDKNTF